MNYQTYLDLKRSVSGFYQKFNTLVLKYHMNKIFTYEYLLETADSFKTFEEFYFFHTKNKIKILNMHVSLMLNEARAKGIDGTTEELIRTCILVRLGNVYTGMVMESKIIGIFNELEPWISCKKTDKEVDINYKVDAIVAIAGIDEIAIQIKPISFTKYGMGSENVEHNRFTHEFGTEVYYIFYKGQNTIVFNGEEIKLDEKGKIVEILESLLVYGN